MPVIEEMIIAEETPIARSPPAMEEAPPAGKMLVEEDAHIQRH
jgi:hypothetical protein